MPVKKGSVRIRQLEFDDLSPVYYLGTTLFTAEKWPVLYRTWDQYEILERFMSDSEFSLVAEQGDELVGFAIGTIIEKHSWSYGYLLWLGVREDVQNEGVGKKLYEKMEMLFRKSGARIMMVDTAYDHKKAIGFFKKRGFENIEKHVYLTKSLGTLAKVKKPKKTSRKKVMPSKKTRKRI